MMHIRPIDQELDSHRVITIIEEDIDTALDGFHVKNSGSAMIPSGYTKMMNPPRRFSAPAANNDIDEYPSPVFARSLSLSSSSFPTSSSHHRRQHHHDSQTMIDFGSNSLPFHFSKSHHSDGLDKLQMFIPKYYSPKNSKHICSYHTYDFLSQSSPKN